ncbi:MAG: methyltransferase domain-containing protein [Alphaproteobacteria bacterium]|nr:methyltransferase domain-containing protein [Alphaproteobacteria bacterium]
MNSEAINTTELEADQKIVALNAHILASYGIEIDKSAQILDFGCGSGRHTYEYLDAGYQNIAGFDARDYVQLRDPSDRPRFRFLDLEKSYAIPFDDNQFDLVVSTSVFEHVINQEKTISEIARILKPGGMTLHVFPSRWRPIEPHIFVPFSGAIQTRWWLRLWAGLGVRNKFQRDCTSSETVTRNVEYCATGIAYPRFHEIDQMWKRRFERVAYAERAFIDATRNVSRVSQLVSPIVSTIPGSLNLYRFAHTRAVLAQQPRTAL